MCQLKEHYVNFFRFFKAPLTTLYTHRIIEFSKTLISNNFLLGLWITKKKCQGVSLCKKVSTLKKNTIFPIGMQESTQNQKVTVFLKVFRHFDSQLYIFFETLRLFYIIFTCNFQIGIRKGSQLFFFFQSNKCKFLLSIKCSFLRLYVKKSISGRFF